jgi:hypothetical protein
LAAAEVVQAAEILADMHGAATPVPVVATPAVADAVAAQEQEAVTQELVRDLRDIQEAAREVQAALDEAQQVQEAVREVVYAAVADAVADAEEEAFAVAVADAVEEDDIVVLLPAAAGLPAVVTEALDALDAVSVAVQAVQAAEDEVAQGVEAVTEAEAEAVQDAVAEAVAEVIAEEALAEAIGLAPLQQPMTGVAIGGAAGVAIGGAASVAIGGAASVAIGGAAGPITPSEIAELRAIVEAGFTLEDCRVDMLALLQVLDERCQAATAAGSIDDLRDLVAAALPRLPQAEDEIASLSQSVVERAAQVERLQAAQGDFLTTVAVREVLAAFKRCQALQATARAAFYSVSRR